jgi:hypothetical protein
MVSAGERTPDYGHTPASLVNGRAPPALPGISSKHAAPHEGVEALDYHQENTVLIIVLN